MLGVFFYLFLQFLYFVLFTFKKFLELNFAWLKLINFILPSLQFLLELPKTLCIGFFIVFKISKPAFQLEKLFRLLKILIRVNLCFNFLGWRQCFRLNLLLLMFIAFASSNSCVNLSPQMLSKFISIVLNFFSYLIFVGMRFIKHQYIFKKRLFDFMMTWRKIAPYFAFFLWGALSGC